MYLSDDVSATSIEIQDNINKSNAAMIAATACKSKKGKDKDGKWKRTTYTSTRKEKLR
jgi:hypothetical protein